MGRIFGTDGARGVVGGEITAELAVNIGRAAAMVLADENKKRPLVVIGMDTRISGDMLCSAVSAGLCSVGADVLHLGVVPTPAVAYLVKEYKADAGVMLSASHNPYEFNGIKLFGPQGFKLTDEEENEIEAIILDAKRAYDVKKGGELGRVLHAEDAVERYVSHLKSAYDGGFKGKILIDCANGSAAVTAKKLFDEMGVESDFTACEPNGVNINENCGSTHIESLAPKVASGGYSLGLAFDGDADRLLAVDEKGGILDGDALLAVLGEYLRQRKQLSQDTIVVTSMTNFGFFKLMEERGIKTEITGVGDRYVLENMREHGYCLGGEQSGHMIFLNHASTGDGQLSAVMLLNALSDTKKPLSELGGQLKRFPQTMLNVPATNSMKRELVSDKVVTEEVERWEKALKGRGRVVVRASGTEPYIRVMVEGETLSEIETAANDIAAAIRAHLI